MGADLKKDRILWSVPMIYYLPQYSHCSDNAFVEILIFIGNIICSRKNISYLCTMTTTFKSDLV